MALNSGLKLYFLDTRFCSPSLSDPLPLLSTLRHQEQVSIGQFIRAVDRQMALAAALLKYVHIHRTAKIPWDEVVISRTSEPHKRPFWDPLTARSYTQTIASSRKDAADAVEFNVSHQAGLVALAGCDTIRPPSTIINTGSEDQFLPFHLPKDRRVGIDITCVSENSRRPSRIEDLAEFSSWVDIFTDVFSQSEIDDMKTFTCEPPHTNGKVLFEALVPPYAISSSLGNQPVVAARLRRFYTYFALKEAYLKMTGEALLAPWLKELEFRNVTSPPEGAEPQGDQIHSSSAPSFQEDNQEATENNKNPDRLKSEFPTDEWGKTIDDIEVWFRGVQLTNLSVRVVGYRKDFIVAIVAKGFPEPSEKANNPDISINQDKESRILGTAFTRLDIGDIRPCAEGKCTCL